MVEETLKFFCFLSALLYRGETNSKVTFKQLGFEQSTFEFERQVDCRSPGGGGVVKKKRER